MESGCTQTGAFVIGPVVNTGSITSTGSTEMCTSAGNEVPTIYLLGEITIGEAISYSAQLFAGDAVAVFVR